MWKEPIAPIPVLTPPHAAQRCVPVGRAGHVGSSGWLLCHPARAPHPTRNFKGASRPTGCMSCPPRTPRHSSGLQGDRWGEGSGRQAAWWAYSVRGLQSFKPSQLNPLCLHTPATTMGTADPQEMSRTAGRWCRTTLPHSRQHCPSCPRPKQAAEGPSSGIPSPPGDPISAWPLPGSLTLAWVPGS